MTTRWVTPDGGRVDVITLTGTSKSSARTRTTDDNHGDGQWLRVTGPHGNYAGKVRTPAELGQFGINLADLRPAKPKREMATA